MKEGTDPIEAAMSMQENEQNELDQTIASDLLGGETEVLGIQLRPVTLASIALLKKAGSDLVEGRPIEECDNIIMDICLFIRIQTLPVAEAAALCRDRNALEDSALQFADKVQPKDIENVVNAVIQILSDATETKVEPQNESGGEISEEMAGSGES